MESVEEFIFQRLRNDNAMDGAGSFWFDSPQVVVVDWLLYHVFICRQGVVIGLTFADDACFDWHVDGIFEDISDSIRFVGMLISM